MIEGHRAMPIISTRYAPERARPTWPRTIGFGLLRIVLAVTVAVVALYLLQDFLLYHPQRYTIDEVMENGRRVGLKPWPHGVSRDEYRAFVPDTLPGGTIKGTVIVVHGNAGSAINRYVYVDPLQKLGYRVLIMEYPGYGARGGRPGEEVFAKELRHVIREVHRMGGGPIYLLGESLGGAVIASALAEPEAPVLTPEEAAEQGQPVMPNIPLPVAGVILVTPWNNLPDLAAHHFWFLPARSMVRDAYDSAANLAHYDGPVVVAVAENDTTIPPTEALALYDSLGFPKKLIRFPGAEHNTWPMGVKERWWRDAMNFVSSQAATSP